MFPILMCMCVCVCSLSLLSLKINKNMSVAEYLKKKKGNSKKQTVMDLEYDIIYFLKQNTALIEHLLCARNCSVY